MNKILTPDEQPRLTPTRMQQEANRKPFKLKELCTERDKFNIDPAFQREEVWTTRMQQALIDTILLGKPIQPLTGYVVDNALTGRSFVITDGHNRISAILNFYDGIFKTWTPGTKRYLEPNSMPPVEPGKYYEGLSQEARDNFLQYHIDINLEVFESDAEITTHFLRLNSQVPLSAAEKLNAYRSKAKNAAQRIEEHPFWEDFYVGRMERKQIFQSSLQLLAIELSAPVGILDLQSGVYFHGLAAGNRDKDITDALIERTLRRLTIVTSVFHGVQFSKRATIVPMYQAVMFLEQAGHTFKTEDKSKLTLWMEGLIVESNRPSGLPVYVQPMQKMLRESAQKAFWDRHLKTVMRRFGIHDSAA